MKGRQSPLRGDSDGEEENFLAIYWSCVGGFCSPLSSIIFIITRVIAHENTKTPRVLNDFHATSSSNTSHIAKIANRVNTITEIVKIVAIHLLIMWYIICLLMTKNYLNNITSYVRPEINCQKILKNNKEISGYFT
ncbi:MAG TPA: hypothetical protein P5267_00905 [Patescibacteria group bacterium]|nr:hypothetical protein [Patescibacteria group bacterium]